ncbi:hypothetical protein DPV73_08265 [Leptospira mayottensis]|nr:hypothetical protein DPV73_08265 [Leptospira mayottensis]
MSKFRSFNLLVVKQKIVLVKNKNRHLLQLQILLGSSNYNFQKTCKSAEAFCYNRYGENCLLIRTTKYILKELFA